MPGMGNLRPSRCSWTPTLMIPDQSHCLMLLGLVSPTTPAGPMVSHLLNPQMGFLGNSTSLHQENKHENGSPHLETPSTDYAVGTTRIDFSSSEDAVIHQADSSMAGVFWGTEHQPHHGLIWVTGICRLNTNGEEKNQHRAMLFKQVLDVSL